MAAIAARTSLENKHNLRKYDYFMILPSCLHSINKLTSTIQMDWWDSECCLGLNIENVRFTLIVHDATNTLKFGNFSLSAGRLC